MVKANEKLGVGKYKLPDKPNQKQNLCLCLRQRRKAANSNKHGDGKPEKEAPQPAEIRIRRIPRTWRHLPNWRKLLAHFGFGLGSLWFLVLVCKMSPNDK